MTHRLRLLLSSFALVALLVPSPAFGEAPLPPPPPLPPPEGLQWELSTLRLLLAKGAISQAEYDSAARDIGDSAGLRTGDATTVVVSKLAATIYGFVEADAIWDSTQSFNDVAGNAAIAPSSTYAGTHARVQFGVRNS